MQELVKFLIEKGGKVVSSAGMNEVEIEAAKSEGRFAVDESGYGFAWLPASAEAYLSTSKPADGRELSRGEKMVGLSFNPSGDERVNQNKKMYSLVIDQMNDILFSSESTDQKRLASIAITEAQGAQMWAVKALTWKD